MNRIKSILIEKRKVNTKPGVKIKHTFDYLGKQINEPATTVQSFFKSEKGSIELADKLLKFYNISLVEIHRE